MGAVAEVVPISPELVLVSPELREHALRLLPAIDPEALFEPRPAPPPLRAAPGPVPEREREAPFDRDWRHPGLALAEPAPAPPRLPVAVAVYTTEALVLGALRGAGLTAAIAILAFVLAR